MRKKKKENISNLREKINQLDSELIKLLADRRKLSKEVILTKENSQRPIRDQQRESELLNRLIKIGKKEGLDSYFLTKVFYEIIEDSVRLQQNYVQTKLNGKGEKKKQLRLLFKVLKDLTVISRRKNILPITMLI